MSKEFIVNEFHGLQVLGVRYLVFAKIVPVQPRLLKYISESRSAQANCLRRSIYIGLACNYIKDLTGVNMYQCQLFFHLPIADQ